ncbi:MAG: hypothetical protein U1F83_16430 [Verrucomicrobiota bacterium]|jgi:hypothetical protein
MNSEPAATPANETDAPTLPELHSSSLDDAQVAQLLADIEVCTELTEILPKFAAQQRVPDTAAVTLTQAREWLTTRAVRGLQLRYRYDGADWWDTLMQDGDRYRIVRIRHEFSTP